VVANWDRGIAASERLRDYFATVLEERRSHPDTDLISELAVVEVDGQRLSDEEIFSFLRLLLPAGVETTYRASGSLLLGLLSNPDQLEAVLANRDLLPQAFEETLRWEPPVTLILRQTTKETVLAGKKIEAHADVAILLGAANRDPKRYERPDEFDIFRETKGHLGFGFGPHVCLGMHLARMETRVAVNALFDRLSDIRLIHGDDVHVHGLAFRSPLSLPISFAA
jgi:cytochrome P450